MGLLNFNYDKPGPGVSKDAPPQKAIPRYFSILRRKFFDLAKLNLIFCVPLAVIVFLVFIMSHITSISYLVFLPVILLFPFLGGLTIVTRNYAREEHAFIFSDFMDAVKDNYKAFLLDGLFCYFLYIVFSISIPYYLHLGSKNLLYTAASAICIVLSVLFLFSQYYVPVLIVTFDLKFGQIIKNSFIFSILGLWRNLLITLFLILLLLACYLSQALPIAFVIVILFVIFLMFSFISYTINFAIYPLINKMMIEPYKKDDSDKSKEPNDFSDSIK